MSPPVLNSCLSDTWQGWDQSPAPGEKGEGCACVCGGVLIHAEHEELPPSQCGVPMEKVPIANPIPTLLPFISDPGSPYLTLELLSPHFCEG